MVNECKHIFNGRVGGECQMGEMGWRIDFRTCETGQRCVERVRQPHHLGNVVAGEKPGRELVGRTAVWDCSTFGIRNLNDLTTDCIPQTRELRQVRFWVVCVPVFGAREGRHKAWNCSGQWSVVSGQRRLLPCRNLERGLTAALLRQRGI